MMGKGFLAGVIASILGLYLASLFVPGVYIDGAGSQFIKSLIFAGLVLGLLRIFIKPILDLITLPFKIITLGLFGILINIAIVEITDILFPSVHIKGFVALLFTSLIIWGTDIIISFIFKKANKKK